jgi:hypothetical protein
MWFRIVKFKHLLCKLFLSLLAFLSQRADNLVKFLPPLLPLEGRGKRKRQIFVWVFRERGVSFLKLLGA